MKAEGIPFIGVLYAGVMITKDGPKALEYNCRFGDPETQVLLPLLKSDLYEVAMACVQGRLASTEVIFDSDMVATTVVAASAGYPGSYPKGKVISGVHDAERRGSGSVIVFHAGTATESGNKNLLVTSGGRVLAVTAVAPSLRTALQRSYDAIQEITFDGMFYRNDIGCKKLPAVRLGVLGSTRGTDLQFIIDAIASKSLNAEITLVISNVADAYILERCKQHSIRAQHIPSKGKAREEFDREVLSAFESQGGVDLVLLIGFMRIVSPVLVNAYKGRMINVHPSLLPEFAGGMDTNVHEAVIKAGKKESGCTIRTLPDSLCPSVHPLT
jgi:folate-dependent phosphoribosylglycinamide formyltransferase PurN